MLYSNNVVPLIQNFNNMQIKLLRYIPLLAVLMMMGCSKDNNTDDAIFPYMEMYVRFVSPTGTNILDSLDIIGNDVIRRTKDDEIIVRGVSKWWGNPVDTLIQAWQRIPKDYYWQNSEDSPMTEGTVLRFAWADDLYLKEEQRPYRLENEYIINLQSPMIFKNDDIHTIKWYVNVKGNTGDAYRCEVDGREYPIDKDPVYSYRERHYKDPKGKLAKDFWHYLVAQITIEVKE